MTTVEDAVAEFNRQTAGDPLTVDEILVAAQDMANNPDAHPWVRRVFAVILAQKILPPGARLVATSEVIVAGVPHAVDWCDLRLDLSRIKGVPGDVHAVTCRVRARMMPEFPGSAGADGSEGSYFGSSDPNAG